MEVKLRRGKSRGKVTELNLLGCKQLPLLLDLRSVAIMSLLLPAEFNLISNVLTETAKKLFNFQARSFHALNC
jgi:hypothetical protein